MSCPGLVFNLDGQRGPTAGVWQADNDPRGGPGQRDSAVLDKQPLHGRTVQQAGQLKPFQVVQAGKRSHRLAFVFQAIVNVPGCGDSIFTAPLFRHSLDVADFGFTDSALHGQIKNIFNVPGHNSDGLDYPLRLVAMPAPDLMLLEVGHAQQYPIVAHTPDNRVLHLLVGPGHNLPPVEEVVRQHRQIVAAVAVLFQGIEQVSDLRTLALDVKHAVTDDDRLHSA